MKVIEGGLTAGKLKFAIVVSRFNELVTRALLAGARDGLARHGVETEGATTMTQALEAGKPVPIRPTSMPLSIVSWAVEEGSASSGWYVCSQRRLGQRSPDMSCDFVT